MTALVIPKSIIRSEYIRFGSKSNNNILEESDFYRIIYDDGKISLFGMSVELDNPHIYNATDNDSLSGNIMREVIDVLLIVHSRWAEAYGKTKYVTIHRQVSNTIPPLVKGHLVPTIEQRRISGYGLPKLCLKISGIYSTQDEVGLTWKLHII